MVMLGKIVLLMLSRGAEVVLPAKRVPVEYQQAVGAETEIATHSSNRELHSFKMVVAAGIEPVSL